MAKKETIKKTAADRREYEALSPSPPKKPKKAETSETGLRFICIGGDGPGRGYFGIGKTVAEAIETAHKAGMSYKLGFYVKVTDYLDAGVDDMGSISYKPSEAFPTPKFAAMKRANLPLSKLVTFGVYRDTLPKEGEDEPRTFKVTEDFLDAVQRMVNYLQDEEVSDFRNECVRGDMEVGDHILVSINVAKDVLDAMDDEENGDLTDCKPRDTVIAELQAEVDQEQEEELARAADAEEAQALESAAQALDAQETT